MQDKKPMPPPLTYDSGLADKPLQDWIPDSFPVTQQVPIVQTLKDLTNPTFAGEYANQIIRMNPEKSKYSPSEVASHEAGHSIWHNDIDDTHRDAWKLLHKYVLDKWEKGKAKAESMNLQPTQQEFWKVSGPLPQAIHKYSTNPSHSFAEAYADYVKWPTLLKDDSPEVYDFLRRLSGFEYSRKIKN